jgi:hypothetical protein
MASRIPKIIDPNNISGVNSAYNNIPVPLEDLTISVQLSVEKKSRSILTADKQGTFSETESGVNIKFIEGNKIGNTKSLTTKFTDLTSKDDDNNDEALGMTSIDIDFNSSYAPQITIQFIDVRGSAIFQNEDRISKGNNKYSVFFQLPYPLYKLSIKGYYGQQVEYCLHMVKFNSRFNSQTGNFELTAQFVGYTYAMLSDALIGYMRAIVYTDLGKKKFEEIKNASPTPIYTLDKLYEIISKINEQIDTIIATSPQADTLRKAIEKVGQLDAVKNNIIILNQSVLSFMVEPPDNNTYYFTIYDNQNNYNIENQKYITNITKAIEEFKKDSSIPLEVSFFTNLTATSYKVEDLKNSGGQSPQNDINEYLNKINASLADDKVINVIDNRPLLNKIAETNDALNEEIESLKKALAKEFDLTVTGELGFSPTIRTIINTITTSIEVLFYVIYEISKKAESNPERAKILNDVFNNSRNSKTDIKENSTIFPWPAYRKEDQVDGYQEAFLGDSTEIDEQKKSKIDEINFINELLAAFLTSQKNLDLAQQALKENRKNWFPVNPLDTRLFTQSEVYATQNTISGDDLIRIIMLRAIAFIGVSNKTLTDEEIIKMANAEYNAVVTKSINKDIVSSLINIKSDKYIAITGNYNNSSTEDLKQAPLLLKGTSESYLSGYIRYNGITIIPTNKEFNNGTWPVSINELVAKRDNDDVNFITDYINSNTQKPDDGGIYVKIIKPQDYDVEANNELPSSPNIQSIELAKLRTGDITAYDIFNGTYGIQTFKTLNYGINSTIDGETKQITDFDYRYIYYALDSANAEDNKFIKVNGLGYTRLDSGEKGVPTKTNYDSYLWQDNKWKRKKEFIVLQEENFKESDFKDTKIHKNYGKNIDLVYESVRGGKKIVYPFIDFGVVDENTFTQNIITPISLFGSNLYYQQTEENAKAILFLHTFPWRGLIQENGVTGVGKSIFDVGEIINSFAERAGFVSVPRLWVAFIGGMLWRSKQTIDPIKFYRTGVNGDIVESFLPTFISNNEDTYPKTNQYLLYQDPFKIGAKKQYGMLFREEIDNDYKQIDSTLLNLPEQAKNEFIKVFDEFVDSDWLSIKSKLEVLDTNNIGSTWTTKYDSLITNSNLTTVDGYYKMSTSILKDNYKNYENYIMFSPYYKTGDNPYKYNYWLELQDDATINDELINLYKQELIISNTTYRIWGNSNSTQARDFIFINKKSLDTYLSAFTKNFEGQKQLYGSTQQQEKKQAIFGTTNDALIKLQLYKNCKNIYDKWIAGAKNGDSIFFQCGEQSEGPKHIIDSFRFLTRSFRDIGDEMAINPFPLMDYLSDNISSSSYDMITSLLSDNNFNFIPLPNFINYRDEKMLDSMFTPYPVYGDFSANTSGPTFVCTYVGEKARNLDFGDSNYITDGFDIRENESGGLPKDFTTDLGDDDLPVAVFKVVYGQQNQNLFKDITLDQSEFSESSESLQIMEDISQKGSPKNRTLGGQNLYDVWSVRSYTAQIEMMGNAMIQPMMYFQLDNIPLFHGAYMITRVKHSIKPNHMSTNFTGVKIRKPTSSIVDIGDFYMSLIDSIETKKTSGTGASVGLSSRNYIDDYNIDLLSNTPKVEIIEGSQIPNKQELTNRALQEISNWQNGALKESDATQYLEVYTKEVPGISATNAANNTQPWSAAFTSYIMLAGDKDFPKSASHYNYVTAAMKGNNGYEAFSLDSNIKIKAEVGDLMCQKRSGDYIFSHCDVIYKVENNKAFVVGGNLSDSIGLKEFNLDNNYLQKPVGKYKILVKKTNNKYYNSKKLIGTGIDVSSNDGIIATGPSADYWSLVAVCALENDTDQGRCDVAQSIYNRLKSGVYGSNTIKGLVISKKQYEPVSRAVNEFNKINDKNTAIKAFMKSKNVSENIAKTQIEKTINALKNQTLTNSSIQFIGGRTDFYSSTLKNIEPYKTTLAQAQGQNVERDGQIFGWFVGSGSKNYGKTNPLAANQPNFGNFA